MKLLDLFCGAGGCAEGYRRAGFDDITGIDIEPQKRYPFRFIQGDALEYLGKHGLEYDMIHASPPCQKFSRTRTIWGRHSDMKDFVTPTRTALLALGFPYVIENVPGAPLVNPMTLCGTMFGLKIFRHRLFETSPFLLGPSHKSHNGIRPIKTGRRIKDGAYMSVVGHFSNVDYARAIMQIDWMTRDELAQAIPPSYTEHIGKQIIKAIT